MHGILKFLLFYISSVKPIFCYQKFDAAVSSVVRRKIDLFSPVQAEENHFRAHGSNERLQYDIVLRHLKLSLNHTMSEQKVLLTRARSSDRSYLLLGNTIQSMVLHNDQIQLFPLAQIEDLSDEVNEFEAGEINTQDNKSNLIVALYLGDRFQIYQIPLESNGDVGVIKSIQKIRRSGQSTKTHLLVHMSNMYLITGYLESDTGKVAVYRWLDYHFSVEDIKDVAQHDELIVHNHKQLVILVLQPAEYPERSINHIYVLNDHRKMVKTQEMYFLFNRLPYYDIDNELYILRCLALDKCFLYKWNGESLFLRVSKVGHDPRNINLFGAGYNVAVMSFRGMLYFYYNQPLLKVASSYVVLDKRGEVVDTRFFTNPKIRQMYVYKESKSSKMYLCLLYGEGTKIMEFIELQLNKQRIAESDQGEQASFNSLKTCLVNIKDIVNIRKGWIDLIKYQINKIRHICTKAGTNQLITAPNMYVSGTNAVAKMAIEGDLKKSPSMLYKWWNALKGTLHGTHEHSSHLFYVDRVNAMQSDLTIRGNLHTNAATLKCITVQPAEQQAKRKREKRNFTSIRNLAAGRIKAGEIVFSGKLFSNLFYRNKVNHAALFTRVNNIHTSSLRLRSRNINRIPVRQALFNTFDKVVETGHKTLREIVAKSLNLSSINGQIMKRSFSSLRNSIESRLGENTVQLFGIREVKNLHVRSTLNKIHFNNFLKQLYYGDKRSTITGNVYLRASLHIRNIHSSTLNGISTSTFFNLRSNQNISASIQMYKVYANKVQARIVNAINIPRDVTLLSATKHIKSIATSNFVVLGDLVLSSDDQHYTRHVLGTSVDDFSQVYKGHVFLKGSVTLNKLVIGGLGTQMYVRGLPASSAINNHFWMKRVEQNIGSFSFQRQVEINQLLCNELNYHPVNTYLRYNKWYTPLNMIFSYVHVRGGVKTYTTIPGFLRQIYYEAVPRASLSTISGRKVFSSSLHTEVIAAESIDATNTQSFATEKSSEMMINGTKQIEHLTIKDCGIGLVGRIAAHNYQHEPFTSTVDRCINSRDFQIFNHMSIVELEIEYLYTHLLNGFSVDQFVAEVDNFTSRVDAPSTQLKIENLIAKANVVSTKKISVEYLNLINLREYVALLTIKDNLMHREIGGSKLLGNGAVAYGHLHIMTMNNIHMNSFLLSAVRASIPQLVLSIWYFNYVESEYLIAKKINGIPTKHLLNANLLNLKIYQHVLVKALHVSTSVDGHITPNVSSVLILSNIESVSNFVIDESFSLQRYQRETIFYEVLIYAVTAKSETIEQKIVFYENSIDFENIWNEGTIVNKNCNFIDLIKDSVKRNQPLIVFNSAGRTIFDATCLHNMLSTDLLQTSINGIDLLRLNQSIHAAGYYPGVISSIKHFEQVLEVVQLLCNDALTTNIYPHHLTVPTHEIEEKNQYHFAGAAAVIGNVFLDAINGYSLQHFLDTRATKNLSISRVYYDKSQHVTGLLTFSTLIVVKEQSSIHSINGIPMSEVVVEASSEHQVIFESKQVKGKVLLFGPTSVIQFNTYDLLEVYKSSVLLHATNLLYVNLIFVGEAVLQNGILVQKVLNSIAVKRMVNLRLSSVEDLLPMIPAIRGQLSVSSNVYKTSFTNKAHMLYIENTVLDSRNSLLRSAYNHEAAITNASDSIIFGEMCTSGIKQLNVTIRTMLPDSSWSYDSTVIQGDLVRAEWREIAHKNAKQLLLLLLMNSDEQLVLIVHVHQENRFVSSQNIAVQSTEAQFQIVNANATLVLLALTEKVPLQQGTLVPKLKLYYYNSDVMRFIHFKTLSVQCSIIVAVTVSEEVMIAVSEKDSNVLMIFAIDRPGTSLYQKIVFDSKIALLGTFELEGYPAIRISTVENVLYVYVHNYLEGWKQYSYGRMVANVN